VTTALVAADGRRWSWRQLADAVAAEAGRLAGAPPGLLPLTARVQPETIVRLLAAIETGRPVLPLHPRLADAERGELLARLLGPGAALATPDPAGDPEERALAVVPTSGTTGAPRGVVLARRAFAAAAAAHAAHLGWRPDDRWLLTLPLAHVGGLSIVTRCLAARRTIVLGPERFDPRTVAEIAAREGVTLLSLVPVMLEALLDLDPSWDGGPALRAALVGGAATPATLLARARERGIPALPTYGLTEACSQVATAHPDDPAGGLMPLPGVTVRIRQDRIHVSGPTLLSGVIDDALRAPPLDEEGLLDTGDLGRLDERGRLIVAGRADEMIVTGGENVAPAEVEAALERCPGIARAVVFGVPDRRWGALVAAALVAGGGGPPAQEALRAHCERTLAPHRRPRRIAWLDAVPLTASGKPWREEVRRRAGPRLDPL
jgi:O-succinylbenzoic acid--CoA ligase